MERFAELDSPFGPDLLLGQLTAQEALGEPFSYSVLGLSTKPDLDFDSVLGEHITVRLHQDPDVADAPRCFDGLVEQVSLVGQSGRYFQYLLVARPWFWFLSQTQDCKVFQNLTVLQIIKEVLVDHPIASIEDRTTTAFTPWVYCVQYRESDFNFLSRLMEQEGIYYYFTHEAGKHTLVLADSLSASEACPGCAPLKVRYQHGGQSAGLGEETCWDLTCTRRVQPGSTVIQDFDFTRTQTDLRQSRSEHGKHALGDMEVFDYPGFYDLEEDGEHFVRAQMEEFASAARLATGNADARSLSTGGLVVLEGSLRDSDNREYLVTGTHIVVNQTAYESGGQLPGAGYSCRFTALDSSVPFRAPRKSPKPLVQGPQTAVVVGPAGDEIFTDKYGRVKVQFHWDRYGQRNERSSCWIRVSHPWAGKGWGSVSIPRIGQEVVVDFLEGDPDQPLITGRVYNAQSMPPFTLPGEAVVSGLKTNTHKGKGFNELSMNDTAGKEKITIHAQYDMDTTVQHDQINTVHNTFTETIKSNAKITITEGTYSHDVAASTATYHVQAALTENFDGTQTTTVKNDIITKSTAGSIQITSDTAHVFIDAATKIKLHVGASTIAMDSAGNISIEGVNVAIKGSTMVTIKGGIVHSEAASEHQTKGAIVLSDGSATNTVKGGMVMLNP